MAPPTCRPGGQRACSLCAEPWGRGEGPWDRREGPWGRAGQFPREVREKLCGLDGSMDELCGKNRNKLIILYIYIYRPPKTILCLLVLFP